MPPQRKNRDPGQDRDSEFTLCVVWNGDDSGAKRTFVIQIRTGGDRLGIAMRP